MHPWLYPDSRLAWPPSAAAAAAAATATAAAVEPHRAVKGEQRSMGVGLMHGRVSAFDLAEVRLMV